MSHAAESAETLYRLHETPPYLVHRQGGTVYRIGLSGHTHWDAGNGLFVPMPGCPVPEKLALANFLYFLHANRRWIPAVVGLGALMVITNMLLLALEGGEVYAASVYRFSFLMNSLLALLAALCVAAFALSNFKKGLKVQWGDEKKPVALLGAGELSVSPDIAVFSESETETPVEYQSRVDAALRQLALGQWLLVLPFRSAYAAVQMSGNTNPEIYGVSMLRNYPAMEFSDAPDDINTAAAAVAQFGKETWAQYLDYCQAFTVRFRQWAQLEKLRNPINDPIKTVVRSMATALCFLLLAMPVSAQKSRQVREYLGDMRYTNDAPEAGADVSFVFQRAVLSRRGDGAKPYGELLKASSAFTDSEDQGKLIGITVDNKPVAPIGKPAAKESVKAAAVSAIKEEDIQPEQSIFDRLPDSTALEQMKGEHLREKAAQWRALKPVADYYMWLFWQLMVIMFGLGGAMWVWAKVSAKDSIRDVYGAAFIGNAISAMHVWSKTVLFILMAAPTLVIIVNDAIRAYYTEVFGLLFIVRYAAIYWVWQFAFEKILPDSPTQRTNNGGGYPGQQRLNG